MGIKLLNLRWKYAPNALGCRWCGTGERIHANRWVPSKKWHTYETPTHAQVQARMWAARNEAKFLNDTQYAESMKEAEANS